MKIMKLMKKNGPMAALFPDCMSFMVKRLGLMADSSESARKKQLEPRMHADRRGLLAKRIKAKKHRAVDGRSPSVSPFALVDAACIRVHRRPSVVQSLFSGSGILTLRRCGARQKCGLHMPPRSYERGYVSPDVAAAVRPWCPMEPVLGNRSPARLAFREPTLWYEPRRVRLRRNRGGDAQLHRFEDIHLGGGKFIGNE